jgi:putative ABC transport system permease protein
MKSEPRTIVGIVGDVMHVALDAPREMQMYFPNTQFDDSDVTVVVRSAGVDPASLAPALRSAIAGIDPQQPVSDMATMSTVVSDSMARRRFAALLFAAFAGIGLVLAGVGIYGAISYAVVQRVHEIGIRVALGARRSDILYMIISQGLRPAILGAAIGTLVSLAGSELLASLLFRVRPRDAATFLTVAVIVMTVGALACYLPARKALRIDPLLALRAE